MISLTVAQNEDVVEQFLKDNVSAGTDFYISSRSLVFGISETRIIFLKLRQDSNLKNIFLTFFKYLTVFGAR